MASDRVIGNKQIYGPYSGKDVRMYLTIDELELLLRLAKASNIGRVELTGVGIHSKTYQDKIGRIYEVWKLLSSTPKPDNSALMQDLTGIKTTFNHG